MTAMVKPTLRSGGSQTEHFMFTVPPPIYRHSTLSDKTAIFRLPVTIHTKFVSRQLSVVSCKFDSFSNNNGQRTTDHGQSRRNNEKHNKKNRRRFNRIILNIFDNSDSVVCFEPFGSAADCDGQICRQH